jgi:WD40 repeat protein
VATGIEEIWDVEFSPDGTLLAVAGAGVDVPLIDVATRAPARALLTNQAARITALAFSPNGRLLATGSADSTIAIWDIATRQTVGRPLDLHADDVYGLAFSPDGGLLASAGLDGKIFLSVVEYEDPVSAACSIAARDLTPEEQAQYVGQAAGVVNGCPDGPGSRGQNEQGE